MAHIEWTDDLNTNIEVIDKQHHRIVEYINTLADISGSDDREQVEKVLSEESIGSDQSRQLIRQNKHTKYS